MGIHLSDLVKNIVGKEEIARYKHNVFKNCLWLMCQNEYLRRKVLKMRKHWTWCVEEYF